MFASYSFIILHISSLKTSSHQSQIAYGRYLLNGFNQYKSQNYDHFFTNYCKMFVFYNDFYLSQNLEISCLRN